MIIQDNKDEAIIEICDLIIEEAQTIFINLTEFTKPVIINLDKHTSSTDEINKIIDYLALQEIRIYEDESDEKGLITNSRELYSPIFSSITVDSNNLNLSFSQAMIDLLT